MSQYGYWERPPPLYQQPTPNGSADVRERLVRCEESIRHLTEHLRATSDRAQTISERANAAEARVQALEASDRVTDKILGEIAPILESHRWWSERKRALRDIMNYVAIAAVVLSAISGKISWKDAAGLLKAFGFG